MKIENINFSKAIMALLVGRVKTGKTIAASSFPKPYMLFFDGRYRILRTYWEPRGKSDIEFGVYGNWTDTKAKLKSLAQSCPYETVVVDPLTFLCDKILADMREMREGSSGSGSGKKVGDVRVNTLEDFGGEASAIAEVLDLLMEIHEKHGVHVIMTAHLTFDEIRDKKTLDVIEMIPRVITGGKKIAFKIPGAFDEVYYFDPEVYAGELRYCAFTRTNKNLAITGTAMNLPAKIDFTDGNFYELLQKAIADPTSVQTKREPLALDVKKKDKY